MSRSSSVELSRRMKSLFTSASRTIFTKCSLREVPMSDSTLELTASFDRSLIWRHGSSVRHLLIELESGAPSGEAAPLNLGIALDVSGSMGGEKIEIAKKAAIGVIECLTGNDRLCIAVFSTDGRRILESTRMHDAGKDKAIASVRGVEAEGS